MVTHSDFPPGELSRNLKSGMVFHDCDEPGIDDTVLDHSIRCGTMNGFWTSDTDISNVADLWNQTPE